MDDKDEPKLPYKLRETWDYKIKFIMKTSLEAFKMYIGKLINGEGCSRLVKHALYKFSAEVSLFMNVFQSLLHSRGVTVGRHYPILKD